MTREVNRLMVMIVAIFTILSLTTAFWSIIQRESLTRRLDNPRRVLDELNIDRGTILDINGTVIAYSEPHPSLNEMQRVYPYPSMVSAIGHYSYPFGTTGVESAFDAVLAGENSDEAAFERVQREIMNQSLVGGDVQTTLDVDIQQTLVAAMDGQTGAAVVVHVPSGNILAMTSQPTYDPNNLFALRDELEALVESDAPPDTRLLNRVTDGDYQPGGALQTLLLSEMLAAGLTLETPVEIPDVALANPDILLTCELSRLGDQIITLADAYQAGCAAPFVDVLGDTIPMSALANKLAAARLWETPPVVGLDLPYQYRLVYLGNSPEVRLATATGQGSLTVSPLHMVQIIASVVNDGNGVPLQLVTAIRPNAQWEMLPRQQNSNALMQPAIAQTIQDLLLANPLAEEVYGHLSRAYAGQNQYAWFLGWTPINEDESVVAVVVLEDTTIEPSTALSVAEPVLDSVRHVSEP